MRNCCAFLAPFRDSSSDRHFTHNCLCPNTSDEIMCPPVINRLNNLLFTSFTCSFYQSNSATIGRDKYNTEIPNIMYQYLVLPKHKHDTDLYQYDHVVVALYVCVQM